MDEAVDQIMGRSSDEKGADKANAVRKSQQKDRVSLAKDIETQQKLIASLNDEAAPIRAEVRKVEAEVGPIKYIAAFLYGTAPDESMLERAVTWIIILIVIVFDPLAVIMLLAAQMTFAWTREQKNSTWLDDQAEEITEAFNQPQVADEILAQGVTNSNPADNVPVVDYEFTEEINELNHPEMLTADSTQLIEEAEVPMSTESELDKWNKMIAEAEAEVAKTAEESAMAERLATGETYIDGDGVETPLETKETIYSEDDGSKKKTYMIKDQTGQIQTKSRE